MPYETVDNTGLDSAQFRELIVRPALSLIHAYSLSAEVLVFGTALIETDLIALRQYGGGPALGLFQMEPATHDDIWVNYLAYRDDLRNAVRKLVAPVPVNDQQLISNLLYAAAMCRVHYLRVPQPLPEPTDADGMGAYYKTYYNTALGAADLDYATSIYRDVIAGEFG